MKSKLKTYIYKEEICMGETTCYGGIKFKNHCHYVGVSNFGTKYWCLFHRFKDAANELIQLFEDSNGCIARHKQCLEYFDCYMEKQNQPIEPISFD